tara:strand:- start:287 stop:1045 length:759 start_codon:yes stop_codon:yes gene_type:complete
MFDNIEIFIKKFCNILLMFFDKNIYFGGFNFFKFIADIGENQRQREAMMNERQAAGINFIGEKIKELGNSFDQQFTNTLVSIQKTVFGMREYHITKQSNNIFDYISKELIKNYGNNEITLIGLSNSIKLIKELLIKLHKINGGNKKKGGELLSTTILIAILFLIHNILEERLKEFTEHVIEEGKNIFEKFADKNTNNKSTTSPNDINTNISVGSFKNTSTTTPKDTSTKDTSTRDTSTTFKSASRTPRLKNI